MSLPSIQETSIKMLLSNQQAYTGSATMSHLLSNSVRHFLSKLWSSPSFPPLLFLRSTSSLPSQSLPVQTHIQVVFLLSRPDWHTWLSPCGPRGIGCKEMEPLRTCLTRVEFHPQCVQKLPTALCASTFSWGAHSTVIPVHCFFYKFIGKFDFTKKGFPATSQAHAVSTSSCFPNEAMLPKLT